MMTDVEALHFVVSDAHHAILDLARGRPNSRVDSRSAESFLEEILFRVTSAKESVAVGDFAAASRMFDDRVRVS